MLNAGETRLNALEHSKNDHLKKKNDYTHGKVKKYKYSLINR